MEFEGVAGSTACRGPFGDDVDAEEFVTGLAGVVGDEAPGFGTGSEVGADTEGENGDTDMAVMELEWA